MNGLVPRRIAGAGAFLVLIATAASADAVVDVINVGCQVGQPPYVDRSEDDAGICSGMFSDIFHLAAASANLTVNITIVETENIDPYIVENRTVQTAAAAASLGYPDMFDAFIAFHTVTPDRVRQMKFSPTVYQTMYRIALDPTFHTPRISLVDALLRESVTYVLAVVAVAAAIFVPVIYVCECYFPAGEGGTSPLLQLPIGQRIFFAMEMSVEAAITASTGAGFTHPLTRMVRTTVGVVGFMYLINIFGAIVTAQLTTSALAAGDPTLLDVRGSSIASASPPLTAYLSAAQFGVSISNVANVEKWAESFYNGSHIAAGLTVHGFVAPEQTVEYLHNENGGAGKGFTMTAPFSPTGSRDLKSFPWSPLAVERSDEPFQRFNQALQQVRESGQLAAMVDKWVPSSSTTPTADDFPTDPMAVDAVAATAITLVALLAVVTVGLYIADTRHMVREAGAGEAEEDAAATQPEPEVLMWRGTPIDVSSPELKAMLDAVVAASPPEAAVQRRRTLLGQPVDGVPPP